MALFRRHSVEKIRIFLVPLRRNISSSGWTTLGPVFGGVVLAGVTGLNLTMIFFAGDFLVPVRIGGYGGLFGTELREGYSLDEWGLWDGNGGH